MTLRFPSQRAGNGGFDVFFDISINNWFNKPLNCRCFATTPSSLWYYCNGYWQISQEWSRQHGLRLTPRPKRCLTKTLRRHQMETFSAYWPFVRGIHRWLVNSPSKGQCRGALMFSLNKRVSKQSWGWWFETPSRSLWGQFHVSSWRVPAMKSFTDWLILLGFSGFLRAPVLMTSTWR